MPINVLTIVGVLAFILCIAVWAKTRRIGPVIGVLLCACVVLAASDSQFLNAGADAVKRGFTWIMQNVLTF